MKKEILITVYGMEIGGIERSLINMLENFDYSLYDVDLLIFNHSGEFMNLIPNEVNVLSEIIEYASFRRSILRGFKDKQYAISTIRVLAKIFAFIKAKLYRVKGEIGWYYLQLMLKYSSIFLPKIKKEYDIAISYAWPHDIIAKKVISKEKIAWIHTDYSNLEIDNKIDYKIWSKFNYIISISDDCTKAFIEKYPKLENKIILMENITSPQFIKKMSNEIVDDEIPKDNFFNIVSVGRLSYQKAFDNAIKALKILHEKGYKDIKWYVVGYGGDEALLRDLIKRYNLQDNFILLGKKINPYPYMKACDLYVQPSRYEGKAVTVTEAQILGKPVLITNYATSRSQIKDGYDGIIVDSSIENMADGIERLYKDNDLRILLENNCRNTDYSNSFELNKLYELFND